jgi:hypothetical protein
MGGSQSIISKLLYDTDGTKSHIIEPLYIPEEDLLHNTVSDAIDKYNIKITLPVESASATPSWLEAIVGKSKSLHENLLEYSGLNKDRYNVSEISDPTVKYNHIKHLREYRTYISSILKKFIPDDTNQNYRDKQLYHCKGDELLKRMTSFNHLRNIVSDSPEKFSKIKFPKRTLCVTLKDQQSSTLFLANTNPILNAEETSKFIDDNLTFTMDSFGGIYWTIENPDYILVVCSTFVTPNSDKKLHPEAMRQMIELCKIAPFDTSYGTGGNVFAVDDEAWIVDGKNKGGGVSLCIENITVGNT